MSKKIEIITSPRDMVAEKERVETPWLTLKGYSRRTTITGKEKHTRKSCRR